jgi:hypothetical protein
VVLPILNRENPAKSANPGQLPGGQSNSARTFGMDILLQIPSAPKGPLILMVILVFGAGIMRRVRITGRADRKVVVKAVAACGVIPVAANNLLVGQPLWRAASSNGQTRKGVRLLLFAPEHPSRNSSQITEMFIVLSAPYRVPPAPVLPKS